MESHSVQILLPADLDAATRNVVESLGSTWSPWGGHVTLISRFTTTLDVIALKEVLTDACTNVTSFPLKLDTIIAEVNRNGRGGHFVMITTRQIPDPLQDLRRRLFDGLKSTITFVYPDIAESSFQPHVSLSLELPIVEALSLKYQLENKNIILQFTVTSISLITFNESAVKNLRISLYTGRKQMAYVLLVEDDAWQAELIQRVLERDQHEVQVLLDSTKIDNLLHARKPNLVITDINMPGFDGVKVIKAVKAFDPDIKVIAFTAVGAVDVEEKARGAGCDAYLSKPMNVAEFRNFVKQNLEDS